MNLFNVICCYTKFWTIKTKLYAWNNFTKLKVSTPPQPVSKTLIVNFTVSGSVPLMDNIRIVESPLCGNFFIYATRRYFHWNFRQNDWCEIIQKIKFYFQYFVGKFEQVCSYLWICLRILWKPFKGNVIFSLLQRVNSCKIHQHFSVGKDSMRIAKSSIQTNKTSVAKCL